MRDQRDSRAKDSSGIRGSSGLDYAVTKMLDRMMVEEIKQAMMCPRCGEENTSESSMCPKCCGEVERQLSGVRDQYRDPWADRPFGSNLFQLVLKQPCALCGRGKADADNPVLDWRVVLKHAAGHPDLEILETIYREHRDEGQPFHCCLMCMVGEVYKLGLMPPAPAATGDEDD
ncbi:MAG TPA: hypothetical protein VM537_34390 [Anaerolineae bacterium]|nr:hypothetical protein [Anaerolineae bacterium]